MWNNIIGQHIRRVNRNLIVTNAFFLFGFLFIALCNARYLANVHRGPIHISSEALEAAKNAEAFPSEYVTVEGEKAIDTGWQEVMETRDKNTNVVKDTKIHAHYLIQRVGDHALLIKTPYSEENETKFTGALEAIPDDDQQKIVDPIFAESPELKGRLLPFMLDTSDYGVGAEVFMVIGVPLCIITLWNFAKVARRLEPGAHPIARNLKYYGDPLDVAHAIDREAQIGAKNFGEVTLTQSWLLKPRTYGLTLVLLDDMVWLYKKVTQHRTNGINTYKSYTAVLATRNGGSLEISGTEDNLDALLGWIGLSRQWLLLGFDGSLAQDWLLKRAHVIAVVDQRRQQMEQATSQETPPEPSMATDEPSPEPAPSSESLYHFPYAPPGAPTPETESPAASRPEFDILPPNAP